ncbi:MAG TPA: hypothetical protein VLF40_06075 [Candidatus Saccharimonadales bacterium]|nr:hypothetical protein [Candidatus Saccharimonadales bacterium]
MGKSPTIGTYDGDEPDKLNEHVANPGDPDKVVEAERWAKYGDPKFVPGVLPQKKWPFVVLAVLLAFVVGTVAFWFGTRNHAPAKPQTAQAEARKTDDSAAAAKRYDSTAHALSFDYPGNWVVADSPAKLTITSPNMTMADLNKQGSGRVVVTVQDQQTSVPGYPSGGALANLASEKITYKHPSTVQRTETYLTYVTFGNPHGIDALFLTGATAYKLDDAVPMDDIIKGNPLVSVRFIHCADSKCADGKSESITLQAKDWQTSKLHDTIVGVLQSLTLN